MTGIAIPAQAGIEFEGAAEIVSGLITNVNGIVFTASEIKSFGAFGNGGEQGVNIRHGAIVQVRRRGPNAVERSRFVSEERAHAVWTEAVHFVALRGRRVVNVVPAVDHGGDDLAEGVAETVGGDNVAVFVFNSESGGNRDGTLRHI